MPILERLRAGVRARRQNVLLKAKGINGAKAVNGIEGVNGTNGVHANGVNGQA